MFCIYCSGDTRVTNSRHQKKTNQVWRRRQCLTCQQLFTTEERAVTETSLQVARLSHLEPFRREKLLISVYDSLRHRPTAVSDAAALIDTVWGKLSGHIHDQQIQRTDIVTVTYEVLRRFDKAAATSYRAFHPL